MRHTRPSYLDRGEEGERRGAVDADLVLLVGRDASERDTEEVPRARLEDDKQASKQASEQASE